jgi:hypothetical protein
MMSEKMGPIISTNGLVFCVDAANPQSIVSGQTTWRDLTFNATGGTLTNGVGFSGTGVSSGLLFDGTDDYVRNITDITTTNQISVNAWFKPTSINNFQHIVDSSNNTWHLAILNTNNIYFWDGLVFQRSGAIVTANSNLMATGVKTDTTNRIYLNGSLSESLNSANSVPTNNVNIGRWQGTNTGSTPSRYFTGTTYGVQIYNRGLSPFEVYQNFNAMKGRYGIPDIVTGGLVLNLDAGNPYSYSPDNTGSTVWSDVSYTTTGGTLVNGTYYTGGTMTFDGTNDYVSGSGTILRTQGTLITWFKTSNTYTNNYLFSLPFASGGSNGFDLGFGGTTAFRGVIATTVGQSILTYTTTYSDNNWHMGALTYNGTTATLYYDGVARTSATITGTLLQTANGEFNIGRFGSFGAHVAASISNVTVYNRALTQAEITQNFNALRGRYGI